MGRARALPAVHKTSTELRCVLLDAHFIFSLNTHNHFLLTVSWGDHLKQEGLQMTRNNRHDRILDIN